jgi:DNA-binding transcriptional regulator of glucitol operon
VGRFLTLSWVARHVLLVVLVTAFLGLGWWQISRAQAGNMLSYGYAVEWPVFAAFVVFVYVKEVRAELRRDRPELEPAPAPAVEVPAELSNLPGYVPFSVPAGRAEKGADDADPDLVAYNRYLEWLAANPGRRPTEYRPEG